MAVSEAGPATTLAGLWRRAVAEPRESPAYLVAEAEGWREVSWADAARRVDELADGLLALGIGRGDRVAILGTTRLEWALVDFALLSIGAAVVPIYPTSSPDECSYILEHAEVMAIVVEDDAQRAKIEEVRDRLSALEHVIPFAELDAVAARGREHAQAEPDALARAAAAVGPDDLLTCIYTSGTTGPPKGCLLTNRNYVAMTEMICGAGLMRPGDRVVLFLPLAHNFGRLIEFAAAELGFTIAFVPNVADLPRAFSEVEPDFFPAVPRVYEKLHAAILGQLEAATGLRRRAARWALDVGSRAAALELEHRRVPALLALRRRVADRLVFAKIRGRLGGRLRFCVSGSAPLAPELLAFFHAAGVLILEGYGLTECTSCTLNTLEQFRFGTVGQPLPGCELEIAEDGEILVRGPHLFVGYLENEEATREAMTDDGWFRTGDIGEIDADGFLRITDRKKDLIATSGGKKVAPQNIENELKHASPYLSQALVVGDRRPYIVALITLDADEIGRWARENGHGGDSAVLAEDERVKALVQDAVDTVNRKLARPEQVKRFAVLPRDFSADEGEVTPTMKLRRRVCIEHFAAEIEAVYGRPEVRGAE